ncbi:Phosphatidylcholine:ceramide cholinephosphotransferase 2 [Aphelenchoides fujianensis]|nr:Phosphatidylcholine:ceramide cholinephosphotransferase 2 [Aphelenchoides fujianensis]
MFAAGLIMRQSELQSAVENQEDEVHITMESPTETTGALNGTAGGAPSSSFAVHPGRGRRRVERPADPPVERSAESEGLLPFRLFCVHSSVQRFRMELLKTAVAFYFLAVAAFLNFFILTVVHDLVPRKNSKRLPDLVFSMIEQQRWAWAVGDVLSTVNAVVGFAIVLLHRERNVVIRRIFTIGAILYLLRAVVMSVTFLPPSFNNREEICKPQSNTTGKGMYALQKLPRDAPIRHEKILCGDLMFSGHTVVLTVCYFAQLQYTPRGLVLLRYISTPITFLGIAALVVSGGHYTMDVLIAYWLTSHVFWAYHQMFELPRSERAQGPMSRLWWYWICSWFESDVPQGRLKNEWNWPFEQPKALHKLMDNPERPAAVKPQMYINTLGMQSRVLWFFILL